MWLSVLHLVLLLDKTSSFLVVQFRVRPRSVRVTSLSESRLSFERVVNEMLLDLVSELWSVDSFKVVVSCRLSWSLLLCGFGVHWSFSASHWTRSVALNTCHGVSSCTLCSCGTFLRYLAIRSLTFFADQSRVFLFGFCWSFWLARIAAVIFSILFAVCFLGLDKLFVRRLVLLEKSGKEHLHSTCLD